MVVASFTDAWIETKEDIQVSTNPIVASFTDAWIETDKSEKSDKKEESHLLQMRGLKPAEKEIEIYFPSRIFYRCVD